MEKRICNKYMYIYRYIHVGSVYMKILSKLPANYTTSNKIHNSGFVLLTPRCIIHSNYT